MEFSMSHNFTPCFSARYYLLPSVLSYHKPVYKIKKKIKNVEAFTFHFAAFIFLFCSIYFSNLPQYLQWHMVLYPVTNLTLLWGVMLYHFRSVGCPKFRKFKFIKLLTFYIYTLISHTATLSSSLKLLTPHGLGLIALGDELANSKTSVRNLPNPNGCHLPKYYLN